ncbi:unnamed protein product [Lymnaea stagnalis]|uniref:Uncharacterized protein n=1 Tax=Lymnaea stagnalis TaxID=6523 RepID=A0AAV2HBH4_LYMST
MMRITHLILSVFGCCVIVSAQEYVGPVTPARFYARKSSTIELPCYVVNSTNPLVWTAKHEGEDLRSRSTTTVDQQDSTLTLKIIRNVKLSDAGRFLCSDGRKNSTIQLIVIDPSAPILNSTKVDDDEVAVIWGPPKNNPNVVKGYRIYVMKVATQEEAFFEVKATKNSGHFTLKDLSPNTEYKIQVVAEYADGGSNIHRTVESPRSRALSVRTAHFDGVKEVQARPWHNNSIIVSWTPVPGRGVHGYRVFYEAHDQESQTKGDVTVTEVSSGGLWQVTLDGLMTKIKYDISVAPLTGGSESEFKVGRRSKPVVYKHDGFTPDMSIHAIPLSPSSVLVAVSNVGPAKIEILRVLQSNENAIDWVRINEFESEQRYVVVTGLLPHTRYFFMAKAKVSGHPRQTITDVMTPPTALVSPTDLNVMATSDTSVLLTWNYNHAIKPVGFILEVNKRTDENVLLRERQQVVVEKNEATLEDLYPNQAYEVSVVPFNIEGKGPCGEPVKFHLVSSDVQITTPVSWVLPYFLSDNPEDVRIESGQGVQMTCHAEGIPHPSVQWYSDGRPLGSTSVRINNLNLSGLQSSINLTCRAENSAGQAERHTRVQVSQPSGESPRFTRNLPSRQEVTLGKDFRLNCSAVGDPKPIIEWYKNDILQSQTRRFGDTVEYSEGGVSEPFALRCVASNIHGTVEQSTKVIVEEPLQAPVLIGQMLQHVEITEGEDVLINCSFAGIPTPEVTWFNGSKKLTLPKQSQSSLALPSVSHTSHLRCRGENRAGTKEQNVTLVVKPRPPSPTTTTSTQRPQTIPGHQSGYRVSLRQRVTSPENVDIRWIVDKGDTFNINHFQYQILDETSQELEKNLLGSNRRKCRMKKLKPGKRYTFNLKTFNFDYNLLHDATLDFTVPYNITHRPNIPELEIEVFEIQDEYARLAIHEYGITPDHYRIQVNEEHALPGSRPLFDNATDNNNDTTLIRSLKPEKAYRVIVEARKSSSIPIRTVQAAFKTPARGGVGLPVMQSSLEAEVSSSIATTKTPAITTPTTVAVLTTIAFLDLPITTPTTAPKSTTPNPRKYIITLSHRMKSPEEEEVKWVLHQGDLNAISSFDMLVVDETTGQNITKRANRIARTWTFPVTRPDRRYTFSLQTKRGRDVLDNSSLEFITSSNYVTHSPNNQELRFEVNEIRPNSAKFDFDKPGKAPSSYRLQVLDSAAARGTRPFLDMLFKVLPASRTIEGLVPDRQYHVIVEARDGTNKPILTATADFRTPPRGGYGLPVVGSSSDGEEATTEATTAATTEATTAATTEATTAATTEATTAATTEATTAAPTEATTAATVAEDTTEEDTTSEYPPSKVTVPELTTETTTDTEETTTVTEAPTTPSTTAATTAPTTASTTSSTTASTTTETELPEDHTFVMTSRAIRKHPNILVIKWQVARGNIEKIKNFEIYVKDANGRYIYNGTLSGNQRYVSFSNFPKGNFTVTLKAIGSEGVLAENDIKIPPPLDEAGEHLEENVNPRLDFGATELRSNSVNLQWDTSNIDASNISGYRVRMFQEGPDGYQVVTRALDRKTGQFHLLELHPKSTYYAVLDVVGNDNRTIMSSALTFTTPQRNGYGESVTGTILATPSTDEPGDPEMKMFIKANATSGLHRVSWNLKNIDTSSVNNYNLTVRNGSKVLGTFELGANVNYFVLDGLMEGRVYDIELAAISGTGDTIIRVETPYKPGTSSDALVVSSRDATHKTADVDDVRSKDPAEVISPEIEMSMASDQPDGHRLSWRLNNADALVVDMYQLVVTKGGTNDVIGRYDFTKNVNSFHLDNIVSGSIYTLRLLAFFEKSAYTINGVMDYTPDVSSDPYKITQPGEELPDDWIPKIEEKDPLPPEMELSVVSDEPSGHRLSWKLNNADESLVDKYMLTVRKTGVDGDVIINEELTKDVKAHALQNLLPGNAYHLTVDALLDGHWLLLSGQPYTPGVSSDPFVVTAREAIRPAVQLYIGAEPNSGHKVAWNLLNVNKELIDKYVLSVSKFGAQKDIVAREEIGKNVENYVVNGLLPGSSYRVELQALSSAFSDPMSAVTVYSPGVSSDPMLITAEEPLDPKIQLSLKSEDASSQRVSWALKDVPARLVKKYVLTVREDGADGDIITYKQFGREANSHVLNNLVSGSKYHVSLEAKLIPQCSLVEAATDFTPGVSSDPFVVTGLGVKLPDTWEPEPVDTEPKLPEMHMSIKARGSSGHRVSWYLNNVNSSLVDKYKLTIRINGDDGDIVKSVELANDVDFHISNVFQSASTYHVEVEALVPGGATIAKASTEYTPGKSSDPLVVVGLFEPLASFDSETDSQEEEDDFPTLDIGVSTQGRDSALLRWNVTGFSPRQLLGQVDIRFFIGGTNVMQGEALLSHRSFTVNGLHPGQQFFVNVTALDDAKQYVVSTAFNYKFPSDPLRASSSPNGRSGSSEDRSPSSKRETYVITRAQPFGRRLYLEWLVLSTGRPKTATLVQYATFTNGRQGNFITKEVPPGVTTTTLTDIDQGTRYGFQVGSARPSPGPVRWSDMVYRSRFN